jgi:hypothetical protein
MRVLRKSLIWLIVAMCLIPCVYPSTREYEIKAGFIYNFFRFVQWPKAGNSYTLGILGSDPFEGGLREFESRPLGGKTIVIKTVSNAKDARACDAVYIGPSESGRLDNTLSALRGTPVLSISDIPEFADKGGAIALTTESNRIRFVVNLDTLKQSELKANSKMLQLASRTITMDNNRDEIWAAVTYPGRDEDVAAFRALLSH